MRLVDEYLFVSQLGEDCALHVCAVFLGSQALHAFWPFVKLASIEGDYREVARALEDRRTIRRLATRIEELAVSREPA